MARRAETEAEGKEEREEGRGSDSFGKKAHPRESALESEHTLSKHYNCPLKFANIAIIGSGKRECRGGDVALKGERTSIRLPDRANEAEEYANA